MDPRTGLICTWTALSLSEITLNAPTFFTRKNVDRPVRDVMVVVVCLRTKLFRPTQYSPRDYVYLLVMILARVDRVYILRPVQVFISPTFSLSLSLFFACRPSSLSPSRIFFALSPSFSLRLFFSPLNAHTYVTC